MLGGGRGGGGLAWLSPNQQEKRCKLPPVAWGLHGEKTPANFPFLLVITGRVNMMQINIKLRITVN